jgi:hypothetical protein
MSLRAALERPDKCRIRWRGAHAAEAAASLRGQPSIGSSWL